MHGPHVNYSFSFFLLAIMIFVGLGVLTVVGVLVAVVIRKSKSPGAVLGHVLAGGAVGAFCLLLVIGLWMGQRDPIRNDRILNSSDSPSPVVASSAEAVAGPGEWLVRESSAPSEPLPEWVERGTVHEGDKALAVISSRQFATPEKARRDALELARNLVQWDFDANGGRAPEVNVPASRLLSPRSSTSGYNSSRSTGPEYDLRVSIGDDMDISYTSSLWTLDAEAVRSHAMADSFTQEIRRTAGDNDFTVYRTHLLVELSPDVRRRIEPIWRQQVSRGRSLTVGAVLAMLTAVLGVFAGYFRLDDRTGGRYRWPLRVGALAALAVIGITLLVGTSVAADATRRPVETPPVPMEVRPPFDPAPPPIEVSLRCGESRSIMPISAP